MTELELLQSMAPFGTERQQLAAHLMEVHHGHRDKAAEAMGMSRKAFGKLLLRLKNMATRRGWSPEHDMKSAVPEGFLVKGVSSHYSVGEDGTRKLTSQWVKSQAQQEDQFNQLMEAIEDTLSQDVRGTSILVEPPTTTTDDLLCAYPIGDPHIGLYAWAEETGDRNFNLKLAEDHMTVAMKRLVQGAPPARRGLLINLGDFFHSDSGKNATTHGTPVETDGRMAKVMRVGVRIMVNATYELLKRHSTVDVYCVIGNHDEMMATVLAVCLAEHFHNNDRVTVHTSPKQHHYERFGKCLIGMHHGHNTKREALPSVMACDRAKDWGETEYRHWYCGHVHHESVKEFPGCTVETMRTLAPKDAWHAGKGYRSGNDIRVDVWHKNYGMISRNIVGIARVLADLGKKEEE